MNDTKMITGCVNDGQSVAKASAMLTAGQEPALRPVMVAKVKGWWRLGFIAKEGQD